jgi:hypothetical protein
VRIAPFVHRCVVKSGDAAGNKVSTEVTEWNLTMQDDCEFCGNPLATIDDIVIHIYGELTS